MPKAKKAVRSKARNAPVSINDLVKHWKLSRTRVRDFIAEGCPKTSLKLADAWLKERQAKRAATQPKLNASKDGKDEEIKGKPAAPRAPSRTGDLLTDALNNAQAVAIGAFEDYEYARVNKLATRSARLSEHNKAVEALLKTQRATREEMERIRILIPISEATEMCRRAIEAVLRRLKKLPNEQGPQCNPKDPLLATKILQSQVDTIMNVGRKAIDEFRK